MKKEMQIKTILDDVSDFYNKGNRVKYTWDKNGDSLVMIDALLIIARKHYGENRGFSMEDILAFDMYCQMHGRTFRNLFGKNGERFSESIFTMKIPKDYHDVESSILRNKLNVSSEGYELSKEYKISREYKMFYDDNIDEYKAKYLEAESGVKWEEEELITEEDMLKRTFGIEDYNWVKASGILDGRYATELESSLQRPFAEDDFDYVVLDDNNEGVKQETVNFNEKKVAEKSLQR
ncbi:MAG: hypothetical protein N4A47_01490 [Clostridia bacterium]|jgi:hypothetical protein|nr:hypothetical protein [Clostridia bacterium]